MRTPISAEEKLAVTLRYLATGESLESLMYQFRIHATTIRLFIEPVCRAIFRGDEISQINLHNRKHKQTCVNKTNSLKIIYIIFTSVTLRSVSSHARQKRTTLSITSQLEVQTIELNVTMPTPRRHN